MVKHKNTMTLPGISLQCKLFIIFSFCRMVVEKFTFKYNNFVYHYIIQHIKSYLMFAFVNLFVYFIASNGMYSRQDSN